MRIEFTGKHTWSDGWVSFDAVVDGQPVINRVSSDALADYFGSYGGAENDMNAYVSRRGTIDGVARILIANGHTNGLGGADVDTEEVERYGMQADDLARETANVVPFQSRRGK